MYSTPQSATSERERTRRPCKIVTFYEDFADASRVLKKFDCIVQNLSGSMPVRATSWSFCLLGKSKLNSIILDDVSSADVVVVATQGIMDLPERIAHWIEICLHVTAEATPVLVGLHDAELEAQGSKSNLCLRLKGIAKRMGARFLCDTDLATLPHHDAVAEPALCRRTGSGVEAYSSAGECARWWGIND